MNFEIIHDQFNLTQKFVQNGQQNITMFKKTLLDIHKTFQNFAIQIQKISNNFNINVLQNNEESESLRSSCQVLNNYLMRLSISNMDFSKNLMSEIIEPFEFVSQNYSETNKDFITSYAKDIKNMQNIRSHMRKCQDDYIRHSKKKEEQQELLAKMDSRSEQYSAIFQKYMDYSLEIKMEEQEALQSYKQSLNQFNQSWVPFSKNFEQNIEKFQLNEDSRTSFCRFTTNKVIKLLQDSHLDGNPFESKLKSIQESYENNQKISYLQKILKDIDFKKFQEKFQTYEQYQAMLKGPVLVTKDSDDDFYIINDEFSQNQKLILEAVKDKIFDPKYNQNTLKLLLQKEGNDDAIFTENIHLQNIFSNYDASQYFLELVLQQFQIIHHSIQQQSNNIIIFLKILYDISCDYSFLYHIYLIILINIK